MNDLWFYGRGSDITGPVTGLELSGLVAGGGVIQTDTIWHDTTEDGIPAGQMPDLFPPVAVVAPVAAKAFVNGMLPDAKRKGRATAGKGVILVGQDGKTVKYKGKCATCGREDASWKTIPIPHGTTRVGFFCAKCRKRRDGEVHGFH